jgi:orotidine-5'-phosphate decarboxylase
MHSLLERPKGGRRIIVALDYPSIEAAAPISKALAPLGAIQKVGLQLITATSAREAVEMVHFYGGQAFLDGKFHDIPNTMAGAAEAAAALKVAMFNIHASAGLKAIQSAVANCGDSIVLAVTVLTSLGEDDVVSIYGSNSRAKVLQFACDAKNAGCHGIVCSPRELWLIRAQSDLAELLCVTPGIRAANAPADDQNRTMTPRECVLAGGDYMVVGRPITQASDPVAAFMAIAAEIEEAEAELAVKVVK